MAELVSISEEQQYARERGSKALVATDRKALLAHRKKIQDSKKIQGLENEINTLRQEVAELREIVLSYVNNNN